MPGSHFLTSAEKKEAWRVLGYACTGGVIGLGVVDSLQYELGQYCGLAIYANRVFQCGGAPETQASSDLMEMLSPVRDVLFYAFGSMPLVAAGIGLLIAARWIFVWATPLGSDDDVASENTAVGVVFGGFMFSVGLAVAGCLFGRVPNEPVWIDALEMLVEGVVIIVLLLLSIWVNDVVILRSFSVVKEIREDRNLGAAFCVTGSCLASGLILNGALSGYSRGFWEGLRDISLYWFVGQGLLALAGFVYHRLARYDVHHVIQYDDNAAAGLGFGGFLLGLGLVVRASMVGSGNFPLAGELMSTVCMGVLGLVLLSAVNTVTTLFVLPRVNYEVEVEMKRNLAAAAVIASMSLALALAIAGPLQRPINLPPPAQIPATATEASQEALNQKLPATNAGAREVAREEKF